MEVRCGAGRGDRIVVTRKDRAMCGELGQDLGPQQFTLKTATATTEPAPGRWYHVAATYANGIGALTFAEVAIRWRKEHA